MRATILLALALALASASSAPALAAPGDDRQQAPTVKIPDAGVPEIMTIEGMWVRAAYNNEGYVILGYRLANLSIGEEWMLLEFGVTVLEGVKSYDLTRDAVSLETPDGKTIPLAAVTEYRKANLSALEMRERVQRDSINYFPPMASRPCRVGFFSELKDRAMAWDVVELSNTRACTGRLFFQIPGGIVHGQHWLNVKFRDSLVRVPFRILTEAEEDLLDEHYSDIRKQVKEAFKPKKD
jgi:hypothetical protein